MTKECGAVPSAVCIYLLLFCQLYAAAVHYPYQRNMEPFGHVSDPELVIGLPGNPGPGHDLVIKPYDHGPFAVDLG